MAHHADESQPSARTPDVLGAKRIDLVLFGDRRLGLPQQVALAATLFQRQFGTTPTVVCLSTASVEPPYPTQIVGLPVQVRSQLPAGYLWVSGVVAAPDPAQQPPSPRGGRRTRRCSGRRVRGDDQV